MWISQSFGKLLQLTVECGREGGGIDTLALVVQGVLISFCPSFHVRNRDLEWSHTGLSHIMATSCVHLSFAAGMFDRCLCTGVCMYVFLTAELASLALCSSCSSVCPSAVFTLLLQDLTLVYHRCCMNKVKAFPKVGSYIVCLTMP